MIARVATVALNGYDGTLVEVETDLKQGLPGIHVVGMGNKAVSEARERVRSAIRHSSLDFPARKLTINLAPAELPKDGAHFDVPIALSILIAAGSLHPWEVAGMLFAGELSLSGELRPIRGVVSIAELGRKQGYRTVFVPKANESHAALVPGIDVIGIRTLKELFQHLKGVRIVPVAQPTKMAISDTPPGPLLDSVTGQDQAKRALAIAAAGRHNLLLVGPPGTGKSMLARLLPGLLPPPTSEEVLEITKLHTLAGVLTQDGIAGRPFRAPHHTASISALIGGGVRPRPGEISLAHHGVLLLDELLEFPRHTLESLRQPLEDHVISLIRPGGPLTYPARFVLVATMNPCPCGYLGDERRECRCSQAEIGRYQRRLSGPLLDRIDLVVTVSRTNLNTYFDRKSMKNSQQSEVLMSIINANALQQKRYKSSITYNAYLTPEQLRTRLCLSPDARQLLDLAAKRLELSARGYTKVAKVARTIADLAGSAAVEPSHVSEALQYRAELPH